MFNISYNKKFKGMVLLTLIHQIVILAWSLGLCLQDCKMVATVFLNFLFDIGVEPINNVVTFPMHSKATQRCVYVYPFSPKLQLITSEQILTPLCTAGSLFFHHIFRKRVSTYALDVLI